MSEPHDTLLPPPADPLGYSDEELKQHLSGVEYQQFQKWMIGQTVGVGADGKRRIYPWDAERGLRLIRSRTPTYWD